MPFGAPSHSQSLCHGEAFYTFGGFLCHSYSCSGEPQCCYRSSYWGSYPAPTEALHARLHDGRGGFPLQMQSTSLQGRTRKADVGAGVVEVLGDSRVVLISQTLTPTPPRWWSPKAGLGGRKVVSPTRWRYLTFWVKMSLLMMWPAPLGIGLGSSPITEITMRTIF